MKSVLIVDAPIIAMSGKWEKYGADFAEIVKAAGAEHLPSTRFAGSEVLHTSAALNMGNQTTVPFLAGADVLKGRTSASGRFRSRDNRGLDRRPAESERPMINGQLEIFPLQDILQWLAIGRRTGKLTLAHGDHHVELYFDAGDIAATAASGLIAADSHENVCAMLVSALAWGSGSFLYKDCPLPAQVAANARCLPVETLLLEALCQIDKSQTPGAETGADEWIEAGGYSDTFTLADNLRLQVIDHLLRSE